MEVLHTKNKIILDNKASFMMVSQFLTTFRIFTFNTSLSYGDVILFLFYSQKMETERDELAVQISEEIGQYFNCRTTLPSCWAAQLQAGGSAPLNVVVSVGLMAAFISQWEFWSIFSPFGLKQLSPIMIQLDRKTLCTSQWISLFLSAEDQIPNCVIDVR